MKTAIYPGSFDPITLGHLDVIVRSSKLFDRVIVGILLNKNKIPLFTVKEKMDMIKEVTSSLNNIEVMAFEGLLIEFAKKTQADVIIRGLRAVTDFEYELQMAQGNHKLNPNVETMFFATDAKYSYLSSSMVKEIAHFGGDVGQLVPSYVNQRIKEKYHTI